MSTSKSQRLRQRLTINPDEPTTGPATAATTAGDSTPAEADAPAVETMPAAAESIPEQQRPSTTTRGGRGARAGSSPSGRGNRSTAKPARGRKPASGEGTEPDTDGASAPAVPRVLIPETTTDAKRVTLYLHPEDSRALGMAKLDDNADANARMRAMIALWRANPRYRAAVDKLARTAPRGNSRA